MVEIFSLQYTAWVKKYSIETVTLRAAAMLPGG
jgi:hypothetical protein